MRHQKTSFAKSQEVERDWFVISASGVPLGRLAARVAAVLRGKHKAAFTPSTDAGDFVIVTNASEVVLTGKKLEQKYYYRASTRPGHLKEKLYRHFLAEMPERVITKAVKGMLPHNPLGRQMARKLKVYAGPEHPHQAQDPKPLEL